MPLLIVLFFILYNNNDQKYCPNLCGQYFLPLNDTFCLENAHTVYYNENPHSRWTYTKDYYIYIEILSRFPRKFRKKQLINIKFDTNGMLTYYF